MVSAPVMPRVVVAPKMTLGDSIIAYARTQVGVVELTGHNDGPEVKGYLESVGLPEGPPYCGAFQHACYRKCGKVLTPIGKFALAAAWHPESRRVWDVHTWRPDIGKFAPTGKPADAVGYYIPSEHGIHHTELFERDEEKWIYTIGGNTSDGSGVKREGGGVYARKRLRLQCTYISRWL